MGFPHFIARRILSDKEREDRLSRPIVVIAVTGIVIGMAVMILTIGISTGFQREVRAKVTGAGSHIEIVPIMQAGAEASIGTRIAQPFYPSLAQLPEVSHIQVYANMPGIIETSTEIQGIMTKGVGRDHDWRFLRNHLTAGRTLNIGDTLRNETMISAWMADRLGLAVGDTLTLYLVKGNEDIRPRRYLVVGTYLTGLEKVDHELVFLDIAHIQRFAQWGLQAEIRVEGPDPSGNMELEGLAFGGRGEHTYQWSVAGLRGPGPHRLPATMFTDRPLTLVVSDEAGTIPDTARVQLRMEHGSPVVERSGSGGSHAAYTGGFEVALRNTEDLAAMDDLIYREHLPSKLRTITAKEKFPEIFAWLELLDTNVVVVIVLLTLVSMINMISALLIIILERTPMIGVLKALGAGNGAIRRIFLIDAAYILGIGILIGDLVGIGLALMQRKTGFVRLPIESYYVDTVPVDLAPGPILLLNIGVLVVCVAALVVPSVSVTRIAPAKAIRFD